MIRRATFVPDGVGPDLIDVIGRRDGDQTLRFDDRQGSQHQCVRDGKHRRVGADAERQRRDDDGGKPGRTPHLAQRILDIAADVVQPPKTAHVAALFLPPQRIAELAARAILGFRRRHIVGHERGFPLVQVELPLLFHLAVAAAPPHQRTHE
jgi:hypothetical protein